MRGLLLLVAATAVAALEIVERPMMLYSTVSPELRVRAADPVFTGVNPANIDLKFTPSLKPNAYNLTVVSDTVISLALLPGEKWANAATLDGLTLYLTEMQINRGGNVIEDAVPVATILPTPTVKRASDNVVYRTGSAKLVINGTNFREKNMELMFDPPLVKDKDYILSVRSSTSMVLTRASTASWRSDPGPLKLRRINTGAGSLRIDPSFGGITVAEVQADLGAHGVTVESTPDEKFYQSQGSLILIGEGFNTTSNTLRFANGLRGKGVNYTVAEHTSTQIKLDLAAGSKWRANPANLPGPLVLLAVDAGVGFVPVGPTEAKKGRTVATIFEDPKFTRSTQTLYRTHSHQLWIKGSGFTRTQYSTQIQLEPALIEGEDYSLVVYNRTHMLLSLFQNRAWHPSQGDLKVVKADTGAGWFAIRGGGVVVANVKSDAEDHPSGVTVARATQTLYQTAAIRKLVITGSGFTDDTDLTFNPPLDKDVDYTQAFVNSGKLVLSLKKHKKWHYEGGPLLVTHVDVGLKEGEIELAFGSGIQVANVLPDPTVEESERIMFASHTRRLVIRGSGFSLEGTELTLRPTPRKAYEIESLEQNEVVLLLNEGQQWAAVDEGKSKHVYVTKIDTGAGEVIMEDEGVVVAKIESDSDDNNCDDSCEWALDGVCDDGSGKGRYWWDDDYGGFYGYDDDYYGYGYYYYGDDDFLAPVCEVGTDCTDCGGPSTDAPVECDNSCQWANDGFCDDTRTSGLCDMGTDCHDCGPVGQSNFSTWDDDGWWDDDDTYWDIDDTFAYANGRGEVDAGKPTDGLTDDGGAGGVFMSLLEGMVYVIGAVVCGGGTYVVVKWYKGQGINYLPVPIHDPAQPSDLEMNRMSTRTSVPITPDVHYT